jgi:hypothetical protein
MANFEGLKNLASAVAVVAVPIVVASVGSYYTTATKEREVSGKFVELAVQILSKEPTKTDTDARIRTWATTILDQYSGVRFDTKTRDDIVNHFPLPRIINTPIEWGSKQTSGVRQIVRIIVRDTQEDDLQKELDGLKSGQVAYHYLILKDGEIRQLKDENEIAFHTAHFNEDSIGIGVLHVSGSDYTPKQIESLVGLIGSVAKRQSIPQSNIVGPSELDSTKKGDFTTIKERVLAQAFAKR